MQRTCQKIIRAMKKDIRNGVITHSFLAYSLGYKLILDGFAVFMRALIAITNRLHFKLGGNGY